MPTDISDDALENFFLAANSGLKANDGIAVNTDLLNGNLFVDSGNNAVWRSLRRNIAAPRVDLDSSAFQYNYGQSFGATIPMTSGVDIDFLAAAHAFNPVWTPTLKCDVPTLPAGGLVKITGTARPSMRTPTAAEGSATTDQITSYLALSYDADGSTLYTVAEQSIRGQEQTNNRALYFEVWIDPAVASLGFVRMHVFGHGISNTACFLLSLSLVWLQVEW